MRPPALAADPSLGDFKNQEEAALKAYEMTRAARLAREIADGEKALAVKKAEYAKLKGSAAPEIGARASESSQQAGPVKT